MTCMRHRLIMERSEDREMDCTRGSHEFRSCPQALPGGVLATQTAVERRAAVAYLQAARLTDDAVERERLRRRGADLLWRGPRSKN